MAAWRTLIEQKWWPDVSKRFLYYGTFWETFIGRKADTRALKPYGLRIPPSVPSGSSSTILDAYVDLVRAHYSEFCELAGAHFLLAEAKSSYSLPDRGDALFSFLEAFNGFYDHLGTTRNMTYRSWKRLSRIVEAMGAARPAVGLEQEGGRALIEKCLRAYGKDQMTKDLDVIETEIVPIRDNHIHESGTTFVLPSGRYWLKLSSEELLRRFTNGGPTPLEEEACARMSRHLDLMEDFLNLSEVLLSKELSDALTSQGINVDY